MHSITILNGGFTSVKSLFSTEEMSLSVSDVRDWTAFRISSLTANYNIVNNFCISGYINILAYCQSCTCIMINVKVLVYLTHIIAIHCKHVKILEKVLEVSATYCCVALRLSTFFFIFQEVMLHLKTYG
jgi:hypothetical protein